MKNNNITRKDFIKSTAIAGGFAPIFSQHIFNLASQKLSRESSIEIHIFSKHLQFLGYDDMAHAAADMGFDGVDLTVRPRGHVLPENVSTDLPKAAAAINNAGLKCSMITTAVTDADDATDRRVLKTASESGFSYYRMGYFHYSEDQPMMESMTDFQAAIKGLGELNKELGLMGCYQNHAGRHAGASMWEKKLMLAKADAQYTGSQYDIRHALVEGGRSWENGLRLIQPHIKTLALKDFKWQKTDGQWGIVNTPIGEGMVDFKSYFSLLKSYGINVPASLHYEYPLGGVEHGTRNPTEEKSVIYNAMKRDLNRVRDLWESA